MKIHEYQGKELFRQYDIAVPNGIACMSLAEAEQAIDAMQTNVWVVKAQIHAGGRGKGGGVLVTKTVEAAKAAARDIFGMRLVTHQTGSGGQTVRRLLIEGGAAIADELYLAFVVDRGKQQVVLMLSSEGGMDIEEVAANTPDKIHKIWIEPKIGIDKAAIAALMREVGIANEAIDEAVQMVIKLYDLFLEKDASLVEINPLVITENKTVMALDSKITFDDNALYRHPDIQELIDTDEEDPTELEAAEYDLSYISLDGNIGCMVNGAGLAMATMDIIKLYGGDPANFLDVGGGAGTEQVKAAFKLMLKNTSTKAILINIFGGIMRCDVIAEGVVQAVREVNLSVPLVVRLEGTNAAEGRQILASSDFKIITADSMADAASKVVAVACIVKE